MTRKDRECTPDQTSQNLDAADVKENTSVSSADAGYQTSRTLLSGLRDSTNRDRYEACWRQFVEKYTPLMWRWCADLGVRSRADAEYITQDLIIKLVRALKKFRYDESQSFRKWMRTSTRHGVIDFWERNSKRKTASGFDLSTLTSPEDLTDRLNAEFDRELEQESRSRVKARVSSRDWNVFIQLTETPATPAGIARKHTISKDMAYQIKTRVVRAIKDELQRMEEAGIL